MTSAAPRWGRWIVGGAVGASAFALALTKIHDTDAWTHLALGREIVRLRGFPAHETFNFPSLALPYYNSEWLFGVLLYLSWLAGGVAAVTVVKATVVAAAFTVVFRDALVGARGRADAAIAGAVVFLAVLVARPRFVERPDVALMLFLALTIYALDAYVEEGRSRLLFVLPLVQVVWSNVHPSLVLVVVPFAAWLVGGGLQRVIGRARGVAVPGTPSRAQLQTIGLVFAAVLVASLVNPYGARPHLEPFQMVQSHWLADEIAELQPPRFAEQPAPYVVAGLMALAFVLPLRRLSLVPVLLVTPFLYLGLSARRFVFLAAIVAAPVLAREVRAAVAWTLPAWSAGWARVALAATAASIVLTTGVAWSNVGPLATPHSVQGIGVDYDPVPEGALRYLDRVGLDGRVFNTYQWGGYIVWRDAPRRLPFVDGRGRLPAGLHEEMSAAVASPQRLERLRAAYGFDVAVVLYSTDVNLGRHSPDLDLGLASPDWALVYWDDLCLVYARRTEKLAALIARDEYRHVKPANGAGSLTQKVGDPAALAAIESELQRNIAETGSSMARALLGFVYNETGAYTDAIAMLSQVRETLVSSQMHNAYQGLAYAHARLGDARRALAYYRKAARVSDTASVAYNIGLLAAKVGDDREAMASLEHAVAMDRNFAAAYPALGAVYQRLGRADRARGLQSAHAAALRHAQAEDQFQRGVRFYLEGRVAEAFTAFQASLALAPDNASARTNLGYLLFDLGRLDEAEAEQRAALRADPTFAQAYYALGLIHRRRNEPAKAREALQTYLALDGRGYWARRARAELDRLGAR